MPFACSALGTLSLEAKSLLNAIASEMSLKHNSPRSLCLSRVVTRISTAIQQGNAFCLVNKMIDLKIYYSSNLQYQFIHAYVVKNNNNKKSKLKKNSTCRRPLVTESEEADQLRNGSPYIHKQRQTESQKKKTFSLAVKGVLPL